MGSQRDLGPDDGQGQGQRLEGIRVLVAEDDAQIAFLCKDFLHELGCRVLGPVPSNERARELIRGEKGADAALLDVSLSDGDSFGLAEELHAQGVPLAFCTGYNDESMIEPRLRSVPRVIKPYEREDLAEALRRLMQGVRAI